MIPRPAHEVFAKETNDWGIGPGQSGAERDLGHRTALLYIKEPGQ